MSKVSTVSAELKKELKSTFPGVKFSVRSSYYHGGSSISVEWNNLPTVAAVEAITNKYSHVNRCEITHDILSGGNTYISTYVDYTPEFIERVEALMSNESKEIKGSYFYTSNFNKVVDQLWKEQNSEPTQTIEDNTKVIPVVTETATTEVEEEVAQAETEQERINTLTNTINSIPGVSTVKMRIFNLNELYIDGVHAGYIRFTGPKIEIIPHVNFAIHAAKPIFVTIDKFHGVIEQFRTNKIIYYNHNYIRPSISVSEPSQLTVTNNTNPLTTINLIGLTVTGETYGTVIDEYSDSYGKDIIIKWEDGNTTQIDVNNITIIDDNTDILNPGYFIDLAGEYLSKEIAF